MVTLEPDLYPLLSRLATTLNASMDVQTLDIAIAKEVQQILQVCKSGKHLHGYYQGAIDGKIGNQTRAAFAAFKADHWLEFPDELGRSTVATLLEVGRGVHPISEQAANFNQKPLPEAGQKTGAKMALPTGEIVYSNQWIVPGCYLTWGEFTANCTRKLEHKYLVANAIAYAKVFGWVRDKYGSAIMLTSGYRPPAINRAVGGARQSMHLQALAGDKRPLDGNLPRLLEVMKASAFTGIGLGGCKGFQHGDLRPSDRVVFGYGC
jgi:hypothetical protein